MSIGYKHTIFSFHVSSEIDPPHPRVLAPPLDLGAKVLAGEGNGGGGMVEEVLIVWKEKFLEFSL